MSVLSDRDQSATIEILGRILKRAEFQTIRDPGFESFLFVELKELAVGVKDRARPKRKGRR